MRDNFGLSDTVIGLSFTFFSCLSVLMVYGVFNAINIEDIKYLDSKYKTYDEGAY